MLVTCTVCNMEGDHVVECKDAAFVCPDCKCLDCGVVMNRICVECEEVHGIPSKEDAHICEACIRIRASVENMDPELKAMREEILASGE